MAQHRANGEAGARQVLRSLIGPVYAPTLFQAVGMTAILPVIPLIALSLGFPVPAAAAITMITGIVGVLGPIPLASVMTVVGERRAMIATGILVALTQIGSLLLINHALTTTPTSWHRVGFIAALVVSSLCREVWVIGRQAYLGTALPPQFRARGMTTFGGMMRIGQVIGPLLGAGVIALGNEAWVIGLDALAMLVATLLVTLCMLPSDSSPRGRVTVRQASGRLPVEPTPHDPRRTAGITMLQAGIGIVPLTMARIARPLVVPLLGALLGLSAEEISLIFAISALVEIAMFIPAGYLMDSFGRTAVVVPCLFFSGAGYLLLVALAGTVGDSSRAVAFWALVASAALIAFGNGFGSGSVQTLGLDLSPEHNRTRHLARWSTITGSGRLLAPGLVAAVTLVWPITAAGAVIGGLCWFGALWSLRLLPQVTPRPPRGPWADRSVHLDPPLARVRHGCHGQADDSERCGTREEPRQQRRPLEQ